jgi:hypothetical protein
MLDSTRKTFARAQSGKFDGLLPDGFAIDHQEPTPSWEGYISLGDVFYEAITATPVTVDFRHGRDDPVPLIARHRTTASFRTSRRKLEPMSVIRQDVRFN